MSNTEFVLRPAVGDQAPDFSLAGLGAEDPVRLAPYLARGGVLLGLFRGLHCPFCRRQVDRLNGLGESLRDMGIETIAVINTTPERGRAYYGRRSSKILLAADPDWDVHRAYGLVRPEPVEGPSDWPRTLNEPDWMAVRSNSTGELPEPIQPMEANGALNKLDGFEMTETDEKVMMAHGMTGAGHFLIDTNGIVRWALREGEEGPETLTFFPPREEILAAARNMANA
jgi:peroxiredoxin